MAGTSKQQTDKAAAAERRASRHKKMASKKRSKNGCRLKGATASGSGDPFSDTVLDLNVPPQDPDHTLDGLRFILRKELKNSDVCNLGRIVLPKKESEENLPHLVSREGIAMVMDDYTSFQVWTFKYRYWPNNRSRMYILENTGDYVKKHNLQTGDFIVIYKDEKKDRYIIRGKKTSSTEEAASASVPEGKGIFESIVPDLTVNTTRHSDMFLPLSDGLLGMDHDYGQGYDFMQDFPTAPFLEDSNTGSTSFTEPLTPLLGWEPII